MKTKDKDMLDRLFAAARPAGPGVSRVEAGFEARLLARIRAERESPLPIFVWAWKLAPVFTAAVIALGVWSYSLTAEPQADMRAVLTAEYEQSVNFLNGG